VAEYLSRAWIEDLNQVAATVDPPVSDPVRAPVCVQQVVTGGANGEVAYAIRVGDRLEVIVGRVSAPDVTITEDVATAVAVGRGDVSPQDALLAGRVRVSGNVAALVGVQPALVRLSGIFDAVRLRTTF
jgi:putative sterol carrier protein